MYLLNVEIVHNQITGNSVAYGNIYDDEKGRFPDGTYIRTSRIIKEYEEDGKHFIQTKNSVYELRGEIKRGDY